jgi:single-strand DNA-binding protein
MNKLTIIGNLTRDPETRVTQSGSSVCSFTVAVNRRGQDDKTDFFRVSAWNKTGETCQKYLLKGRKVAVTGPVSVSTYTGQDGKAYANLEVMAQDVEFLSPKAEQAAPAPAAPANNGYQEVVDDNLPF